MHVTGGVVVMIIVLGLALSRGCRARGRRRAGLVVLALRGRRLGGGVHGGLLGRPVSPGVCKLGPGSDACRATPEIAPTRSPGSTGLGRDAPADGRALVLALGLAVLAAGVALGTGFLVVGAVILVAGLGIWIGELMPGRGHIHEPLVEPARVPARDRLCRAAWTIWAGHARLRMRMPEKFIRSRPASREASSAAWSCRCRRCSGACSAAMACGIRSICWPAWCCRASADDVAELQEFQPRCWWSAW